MSEWRHTGKQVLQDGRHFADAVGELEAMMIVNALRAVDERDEMRRFIVCDEVTLQPKYRGGTVAPSERLPLVGEVSRESIEWTWTGNPTKHVYQSIQGRRINEPVTPADIVHGMIASLCRPRREGDEYVCSKGCGVRWDVREPAPRCGRAGNG